MSINLDTAARVQIPDAADTISHAYTGAANTITIPKAWRGRYLRILPVGADLYVSVNTVPSTSTGFLIADGVAQDFFVPTGSSAGDYVIEVIGAGAGTATVTTASP